MKRFLYIMILSAATATAIWIMNVLFTEEEIAPDRSILDRVTDEDFDLPAPMFDEPSATDVSFPRSETILDEEGREREVQTASFHIEYLKRVEGNEVEARNITFEFYDKERYDLPVEERILAKGRADRAKLFSASDSTEMGMNMEFKQEFVLEDNILVETFDPRTGAPSFNLEAQDLIFRENRFDSTEAVVIYKTGLSISGEGLICDIDASLFTLKKSIRIEGSEFDLSEITGKEAEQRQKKSAGAALIVTADGPLDLKLSGASEAGTGALGSLQTGVQKPLSELEIQNNVVVTREDMSLKCDRLIMNFLEGEEGKYEIHSLRGLSLRNRTVLDTGRERHYVVHCDAVDYRLKDGMNIFRIHGTPEISNVSLPLFSSLSDEGESTTFTITCGDVLKIETPEKPVGPRKEFEVSMTGRVIIADANQSSAPVLEADELTFVIAEKDDPAQKPGDESISIQEFLARGDVSGHIENFVLACSELTYSYSEAPDGHISRLELRDPEESLLKSDEFSIVSPTIDITIHPDTTEIIAHEIYRCESAIEELPRLKSFDVFEGNAPAPVEEEVSGGTVTMRGRGTLRLLVREDEAGPSQSVIITESDAFDIEILRGSERMLYVTGKETFSLMTKSGQLDRLHLDNGGEIVSRELGFTTSGDVLHLTKGEGDAFEFETRGSDGSAFVTFTREGSSDPIKIHGDSVKIFSGKRVQLTAKDHADAHIPVSLLEKREGAVGSYRIQSDLLTLDRPEGVEDFTLNGRGSVVISNDALGLIARCERFDYGSGNEVLTLRSTGERGTIIRIRSTQAKDVYDEILSETVEMNMNTSTVRMVSGGVATLHLKDEERGSFNRVHVDCENEITLIDNLLEFNGPLEMDYESRDPEGARSMACRKLKVYFEKSPLKSPLTAMDLEAYKALVKNGAPPAEEENRIKRIEARDDVVLEFKTYHVTCALLTWNILEDELMCEGLEDKVRVSMSDKIILQGSSIAIHPVSEEIMVTNQ